MSSGTLKQYVNDVTFWKAFNVELDELIAAQHRNLEQATNVQDVYRCQGEIHALKRLKMMRDKYNG